jgi:hypothetical protein
MSTDSNPYVPPEAVAAGPSAPTVRRGKSLLPLWLAGAYLVFGTLTQLLAMAVVLVRAWPFPPLPGRLYVALLPILLLFSAGIALFRRAAFAPELLLTAIILRTELRLVLPLIPGQLFIQSPLDIADWLVLLMITLYAFQLRGRGVLGRDSGASAPVADAVWWRRPASVYCLVPGVFHLLLIAPWQLTAMNEGTTSGLAFLLEVVAALLRVTAGWQLLRGSLRRPVLLVSLCVLGVLRATVPVFQPSYLGSPAPLLLADLVVLALLALLTHQAYRSSGTAVQ